MAPKKKASLKKKTAGVRTRPVSTRIKEMEQAAAKQLADAAKGAHKANTKKERAPAKPKTAASNKVTVGRVEKKSAAKKAAAPKKAAPRKKTTTTMTTRKKTTAAKASPKKTKAAKKAAPREAATKNAAPKKVAPKKPATSETPVTDTLVKAAKATEKAVKQTAAKVSAVIRGKSPEKTGGHGPAHKKSPLSPPKGKFSGAPNNTINWHGPHPDCY